jgi:hypothetical protein
MEIITTIEAIPNNDILRLPNFHAIIYKKDNGIYAGHCLDFDLWAYSKQDDLDKAIAHIFNRLRDMALIFIIEHLKNKSVDNLYENAVKNSGEWAKYSESSAKIKIKNLKLSFELLAKNKELLKEIIDAKNIRIHDFSDLSPEAFKSLQDILSNLQKMDKDKAEDIIFDILNFFPNIFTLAKVA